MHEISRTGIAGMLVGLVIVFLAAPRTPEPQPAGPTLTVPPGFTVERVAGPPLVNRPIVAD